MNSAINDMIAVYGVSTEFPHGSEVFKQIKLQDVLCIPAEKPDIEHISSLSAKIEITETRTIPTPSGRSCEGQILTGKKLVVEGKLCLKLEYTADIPIQPIHGAHFRIPFSSYIVIGKDSDCFPEYEVNGYIEDIFVKQLNCRRVFINLLLLLNADRSSKI